MIRYTIKEEKFKYNMKKGVLKVGSSISIKEHPLKEVNDFRNKLITEKKIKKVKNEYIVIRPIKVGMLMAYNLHHGVLKKKIDNDNVVYVSEENDKDIISSFDIKNMSSTNDDFMNSLNKNENKLIGIYEYEINSDFFIGNSPNSFSNTELLVANYLKEKGVLNKYRHGDAEKHEADIIDEKNKVQIEVVFEYKNKIKKRGKMDNDPLIISELIDTNLISTSDALISKHYKKDYSSIYEKQIAILCLGNLDSAKTMLTEIQKTMVEKGQPKNVFKKIYIICIDIIDNIVYFYDSEKWNFEKTDKYTNLIIQKNEIYFENIIDDKNYLYEVQNIFNRTKGIGILDGKTIKQLSYDIDLIKKY